MPKIHETRKRSLLKAVSVRIIGIALDAFILSYFVETHIEAFSLALALEGVCLMSHYAVERGWNRISWGRYIE